MTVPSPTTRSGPYDDNGSTAVFVYGFRILDENEIEVVLTDSGGTAADYDEWAIRLPGATASLNTDDEQEVTVRWL